MANVDFKRGLLANLPAAITDGTIYVTTDERAIYIDIGTNRVRIGDFQEFDTLLALQANTNPSMTAMYYVSELNCLAKWDGEKYIQINIDTGATAAVTTGTGNALDGVSYDPATRKLTFTKTSTFTTADDVDTQIDAKVGALKIGDETFTTVKAYVDKKTDGIATDAALKGLTERVTNAEDTLNTLIGDDTGKSARSIANEELAKQLIPENAKESLDSLAEIATWIQAHPDDAAAMNKAISDLTALVGTLPEDAESATVVAYIKEAIDAAIAALEIADYAKAADLSAAVERIESLEGKAHEHDNLTVLDGITAEQIAAWNAAEQNAKDYADGLTMEWGSF